MIARILPGVVVAEEAFTDPADVPLFRAEETVVSRAVAQRRAEFATVRLCARTALHRLGVTPGPILPDQGGAPRWPAGIVGSMTHCAGYRAAAVASARDIVSIGIDAEPHEGLPEEVLAMVSTATERTMLARLAVAAPGVCWDRLLFSAKESVYKAWFPLTHRWLDFTEAEVVIEPARGRFAARLLVDAPTQLQRITGSYVVGSGLVLTATVIGTY